MLLTVAVSTFLFFFLSKEENRSSVFAFNLGYTVFLEILFFIFIFTTRLSSKKVHGAIYSVLGTVLVYYLIFGIVILLAFNIFMLELISPKWYYAVIIIGTLTGVIVTGFVYRLNSSMVTKEEESAKVVSVHSSILQKFSHLESIYKSAVAKKGLTESLESNYDSLLEKLINKLRFVSPQLLQDSTVNIKLSNQISVIENLIQQLKEPDSDGQEIQQRLLGTVDDTLSYIKTLK